MRVSFCASIGCRNSKYKGKERTDLPKHIKHIMCVYDQATRNMSLEAIHEDGAASLEPCTFCKTHADPHGRMSARTCALCAQTAHPMCLNNLNACCIMCSSIKLPSSSPRCAQKEVEALIDSKVCFTIPEYMWTVLPPFVRRDYNDILCGLCCHVVATDLER